MSRGLGDVYKRQWIKNAGHNSNTDQPDEINSLIEKFIRGVECI